MARRSQQDYDKFRPQPMTSVHWTKQQQHQKIQKFRGKGWFLRVFKEIFKRGVEIQQDRYFAV